MSRGSSTGDDEVFVVEASGHGLEKGILRTPLFASDFGRYHFTPQDKWRVIFPYVAENNGFRLLTSSEFQKKFPKAFAHLQQNAGRLRERKQFKEWFGYSAPRNLELHDRAQIAVPLLADGGLFALIPKSSRGTVCSMASGGFTITLGEECVLKPEFVLGILNSKLSFWFLCQISNVFRGGWITCTKQYFGELPIIRLDLKKPAAVTALKRLIKTADVFVHRQLSGLDISGENRVMDETMLVVDLFPKAGRGGSWHVASRQHVEDWTGHEVEKRIAGRFEHREMERAPA